MKYKKIPNIEAEKRPVELFDYMAEHGRSSCYVKCPFCGEMTMAYVWSLCGSGKRCGNKECRAHLGRYLAIRDLIPQEGGGAECQQK